MEGFIKKDIDGNKFELLIDKKIFSKDLVLKAAYNFLDKGYFFFKLNEKEDIILQFTPRNGDSLNSESIIGDYYNELLSIHLRNQLEVDNKKIREAIYNNGLGNSLDTDNFVELDVNSTNNNDEIDFDKDIDEILKEIENDPELKIDEEEIEKILKEIEDEELDEKTDDGQKNGKINLDLDGVKEAKEKFEK